jgi:hypothetical protein
LKGISAINAIRKVGVFDIFVDLGRFGAGLLGNFGELGG